MQEKLGEHSVAFCELSSSEIIKLHSRKQKHPIPELAPNTARILPLPRRQYKAVKLYVEFVRPGARASVGEGWPEGGVAP